MPVLIRSFEAIALHAVGEAFTRRLTIVANAERVAAKQQDRSRHGQDTPAFRPF